VSIAPRLSIVVIGRNEGERLIRCFRSVREAKLPAGEIEIVYVDCGSSDGSAEGAADLDLEVIAVQPQWPTAALAREVGWRATSADIVLFLDGDCMLEPEFTVRVWPLLDDPSVAVIWGRISEWAPMASIYHRVLGLDWITPAPGPSEYSGGCSIVRRLALEAVDGFRIDLIAGEDADLCRRIRQRGWIVWHSSEPMVAHDLAITRFGQYARRCFRIGYSHAMLHPPDLPGRHGLLLANRAWGAAAGGFLIATPAALWLVGWPTVPGLALLVVATFAATLWSDRHLDVDRGTWFLHALHWHFKQIPMLAGQIMYAWDRWRGHQRRLIEYKGGPAA
jgi:glycosyltransferase involved in cell wall biosynthesis